MYNLYEHDNPTDYDNLSYGVEIFYLPNGAPGIAVKASRFTFLAKKFRDCWQSDEMP
jgi:hypothetical protein